MKHIVKIVVGAVALIVLWQVVWLWGFCRFYVGPNEMGTITAKNGEALEPGEILAREGQKGIQEEPLGG